MQRHPDIELSIQCGFPKEVIARRLGNDHFEHDQRSLDVGLVQPDPLSVDLAKSQAAYRRLHQHYEQKVNAESRRIQARSPDLVISDIAYLPIAAAAQAGVPAVALASVSWDHIIKGYFDMAEPEEAGWYHEAVHSYQQASLALLPEPAMEGDSFTTCRSIPPIAMLGEWQASFRTMLRIDRNDQRPIILCSLGGMDGTVMPISAMEREDDFHWLVAGKFSTTAEHIHLLTNCTQLPYKDIIASVDGVVGKPGYGMAVEVAAHGLPLVFAQRGHFPDEPVIIEWLNRHARVREISKAEWMAGDFTSAMQDLLDRPKCKRVHCNGAAVGAELLSSMFL